MADESEMSAANVLKNFRNTGKKIVAVARNYKEHAAELNNPVPKAPVFFMKATTSYLAPGKNFKVPNGCTNCAHEVELAVIIGKKTQAGVTTVDNAHEYIAGYALALDMTARDWQSTAKNAGLPWFMAKSFDHSCPISDAVDVSQLPKNGKNVPMWLKVNGEIKQKGNTNNMIFDIPTQLAALSQHVTMEPGDCLLTGTPEGVSQVKAGDVIECGLGDNDVIKIKVNVE